MLSRSAPWFYAVYAACVLVGAALAGTLPNLIWLTIAAQIINVFLLPMVLGFLVVLAALSLSGPGRVRGWYLSLSSPPRRRLAHALCSGRSTVFSRRHWPIVGQTPAAPRSLAGRKLPC
jgi:hypothetical protein